MSNEAPRHPDWPRAMRRYLGASIGAHMTWELLQLPLYTLWATGTLKQQAFAVFHCTTGDAMITGLSLLASLALFARSSWPQTGTIRVWVASVAFGVFYTMYSEWLNVNVRGSWTYSDLMPVLPMIGTGLAPLLQWFVVPTLALWFAIGHAPWSDERAATVRYGDASTRS